MIRIAFGRRWKDGYSRIGISHPIANNQTLFSAMDIFKRPKLQFVYAKIEM
jgi:hypothetical protein